MRWTIAVVAAACGRVHFDPIAITADAPVVAAGCLDGLVDGDETGLDCGGSCLACVGSSCSIGADCMSGNCVAGQCELASGPPFWLPGPPLGTPRQRVGCANDQSGTIVVVGGSTATTKLATTEKLAPFGAAFVPGPTLLAARDDEAVATTTDSTVYAFGGYDQTGMPLDSLEALAQGSWSARTGTTTTTHALIAGAGGLDGKLYVVDSDGMWVYTPASDSWVTLAAPTNPRDSAGVVRGQDAMIYAIGGRISAAGEVYVDAWDVTAAKWQARAPLHTARELAAAAAPGDGRVYAITGLDANGNAVASVEAYATDRDRWIDVAPVTTALSGACAAVGPDGRIYLIGGYASSPLASVEIYGPVITLSPATAAAGTTVTITGTNFAAEAVTSFYFDSTQVALGTTDAAGSVSVDFVVPAATSGQHRVLAGDEKSGYPTEAPLQVP